ncbi:BTAD domain-containing putative transcriptional regulator [Candidatus Chloroploca sp. Khr17]|uniref:BTAD domain-containing putative transcriptional regulator n=1 Tax=Candidatus Chloroploca sp. Khr17 TaxID=2496869 RepID=UPI00101BE3C1|nr:BTAD domain-containing putative transcriptional regulator [Candidatus Chloroploca sp. Khr17]
MVSPTVTGQFGDETSHDGLLLTRLTPPAQQTRLLRRQRVETTLSAALDYPICLVVAPAGSGKTTAMAALATYGGWPAAWCRARASDDPALLLRHLAAAFRPIATLDEGHIATALQRATDDPLGAGIDTFVNELAAALDDDTLLVVDDYHVIDQNPNLQAIFERLLAIQPLRLHLALVTRVEPHLMAVETARIRGELLSIDERDLAFITDEARALAVLLGTKIPSDLDELIRVTRGWPLGVQAGLAADSWPVALGLRGSAPLDTYLKREVFDPLAPDLQRFLLQTAGLRQLEPDLCALLVDDQMAGRQLAHLERKRLFIERDAEGIARIQPVFRSFLARVAEQELTTWPLLHQQAATYYHERGDREGVMHHLLLAGDHDAATARLIEGATTLLDTGHAEQVLTWAVRLIQTHGDRPELREIQAAALRRLGHYEESLQAYAAASNAFAAVDDLEGQVRSLHGQAAVYLDTVQPAHATDLLKQAFRLLPPERTVERADLLRMQAENWANRGRADVALILEQAARRQEHGNQRRSNDEAKQRPTNGPPRDLLPPRLLLRAGRLDEARQQLEAQLWAEAAISPDGARLSAHREPLLLLALIYGMLGSGTRALAMAQRGLVEAQQVGSRLTEAIALLRVGHAYQLVSPNDMQPVIQRYAEAMNLIQSVGVTRTRAEGYMGLTLLYGHAGDLPHAEADAREGLQIAAAAGDEWTAALILLALGGAAVAGGDHRAGEWLEQARQRFARGGDAYGLAVTTLWRAIAAWRAGEMKVADQAISEVLHAAAELRYVGILMGPSLFGPRDMASLVPLLLRGRSLNGHAELARLLLRQGFPTIAADDTVEDYHPGYTLRVQMLGTFRVWRGAQEIQAREWQREKARQLFQLLLTYRGHWVQREQICAWLWPEADLEAAERQFKVTLNALNAALEPARPPRVAPFFVRRQGLAYSFAPSYGVWIDVDEFELRTAAAIASDDADFARRSAQIAVGLYRGDYLAESLYDPWTTEERERLTARFLAIAVRYAARLSNEGDQARAIQLCEQVLRRDRCYEEAYQVLMRAHARTGSRSQALRSYNRCVQSLRDELGMEALPETEALYEALKRNEAV